MYKIDYRFTGDGLWSRGLPATLQAAWGQARVAHQSKFADEARVTPASTTEPHRLDLRI